MLVTVREIAEELRVNPQTIKRWASRGHLTVLRTPGGHLRVSPEEVTRLREQMRQTSGALPEGGAA